MTCPKDNIEKTINLLQDNKIIALPTESVYGLSCCVNPEAVNRLLKLKSRARDKGFIIVASDISLLMPYIDGDVMTTTELEILRQDNVRAITWVVPAKKGLSWLTGAYDTVAVRLTRHPLLSEITRGLKQAIISTSANISGAPAATCASQVEKYFGNDIDFIFPYPDFKSQQPSRIIELKSGKIIRP
ncbi:MAG: L-threonylcarbamoyladenylate synthase [Francisellaceae bacterium]